MRIADLVIPDEHALARVAARMASLVRPGDTVLLDGPIGAGKTAFARAFLRAWTSDPGLDVPSPTYTLVQVYGGDRGEAWHADLYRLGSPADVIETGLAEAMGQAVCLIEWPDRLGHLRPDAALRLDISHAPDPAPPATPVSSPLTAAAIPAAAGPGERGTPDASAPPPEARRLTLSGPAPWASRLAQFAKSAPIGPSATGAP